MTMRSFLVFVFVLGMTAWAGDGEAPAKKVDPVRIPAVIDLGNGTCPIGGEDVDGESSLDWNGLRVHLCCPGCEKKFRKDPAAALAKLGLAVEKQGDAFVVDLANPRCPIRGGDAKADVSTVFAGVRVHYCCPGCEKKLAADPVKAFRALGYTYVPSVVDLRNATCPVSGKPAGEDDHVDVDGVRVRLCCPGCAGRFEKDPAAGFTKLGVDPARVKEETK